jgi:hypothetical protein
MANKQLTCPECLSDSNTFKVSEIYLQSLARLKNGDTEIAPIIDKLQLEIPEERRAKLKGSRYYRELMESFAPPQGETQITRAVNPDWIAIGLAVISIYILYQILISQTVVFWYMVGFAIIGFAAYFIFRKQIFAKYNAQRNQESGNKGVVEKAIGMWMKLYYCSKDNVVFGAKKDEAVPIDQMRSYLMSLAHNK